jgi:hypothetical protein
MNLRELKALEIAALAKITFLDGVWIVPSQSNLQAQCNPFSDGPCAESRTAIQMAKLSQKFL